MGFDQWRIRNNTARTAKEAKKQTELLELMRWDNLRQTTAQAQGQSRGPAPAGWYGDPSGQPLLRWWDGQQWTEHTREAPLPGAAH